MKSTPVVDCWWCCSVLNSQHGEGIVGAQPSRSSSTFLRIGTLRISDFQSWQRRSVFRQGSHPRVANWGRCSMFTKSLRFLFLALDLAKTISAGTNPANLRNHIKWRRNGARLSFVLLLLSWVPAAAGLQATNTTLAVTVAGTVATTAASGSAVTLIATVTTTGPTSTPVTPGQVRFCDASAKFCSDIHLLGTAQLTKDGTARFTFIPSPGSHSYKAVFVGTTTYAGSMSGPANLTVTGLYPTVPLPRGAARQPVIRSPRTSVAVDRLP